MSNSNRDSDAVHAASDEVEAAVTVPPDPDSLRGRFADPRVRSYLFTGLAAVAMVFVIMFQRGSDLGGVLLLILAAPGMVLRWPAAPLMFLFVLFWFLIFPFGFPDDMENRFEIIEGRFRVEDMILVASVVIYLACHYRLYGITAQAIPFENRFPRKDDKPPRRPASLIQPGEIARLLFFTAAVVIAGQLVWIFATHTEVIITSRGVAFAFAEPRVPPRGGTMSPEIMRFILLAGLFFFGTVLARLVFGYWRLRLMSPAEGRMILQDGCWDESRRELARVEGWRAWGRKKQQEQAEQQAGPSPGQGATR